MNNSENIQQKQPKTNETIEFIKNAVIEVKDRPEGLRGPYVYRDEQVNA